MPFKLSFIAILAAIAPSALYAQSLKTEILANETKVWRSFLGSHPDKAAFQRLIADDYLCIEPTGVLVTKAENIAELDHLTFSSFQIHDPQVRALSPSAALIVARLTYAGTVDGRSISGETLTSTVWVKRDGQWLAQSHTETFKK